MSPVRTQEAYDYYQTVEPSTVSQTLTSNRKLSGF